jgi:hypothetical protein
MFTSLSLTVNDAKLTSFWLLAWLASGARDLRLEEGRAAGINAFTFLMLNPSFKTLKPVLSEHPGSRHLMPLDVETIIVPGVAQVLRIEAIIVITSRYLTIEAAQDNLLLAFSFNRHLTT